MRFTPEPGDGPAGVSITTRAVRRASLVAGAGLLSMTVLAVYGNFVVLSGLVTPGDAAATAAAIADAEGTFRLGVACLFLVAILDVIVAWGLYVVFAPASRSLSLLAAWFRVVYAGVFAVAISNLVGVPRLVNPPDYLDVYTTQQLQAQVLQRIETFNDVWSAGLLVFGVHLLVLAYVAYRAEYVPTGLAVLLGIAGLGYAIDSLGAVLFPAVPFQLALFTFVGEVVLLGWLLLRGRKLELGSEESATVD